jgi:VanZ family protein
MAPGQSGRTVVRAVWAVLIGCVIVGSLLPAKSPVIAGMGRLHISLKVLHFVGYAALGWMATMAVRRGRAVVMAALAMVLLGVALEFAQKLSPGRSCEIGDMALNGAGVLAGIGIGGLWRRIATADNEG